jgi:uncharacterized protein YjiS (DUF1127 family)
MAQNLTVPEIPRPQARRGLFYEWLVVAAARIKSMLSPILCFIQNRKEYERTVQELSRLSDRELADVGITRCDIDRIARGARR